MHSAIHTILSALAYHTNLQRPTTDASLTSTQTHEKPVTTKNLMQLNQNQQRHQKQSRPAAAAEQPKRETHTRRRFLETVPSRPHKRYSFWGAEAAKKAPILSRR